MGGVGKQHRYLLIVGTALALVILSAGAAVLAQSDGGDVFTGCLDENSGKLDRVAVGFEPAEDCKKDTPITWDRAGPAFEGRILALEDRVTALEGGFGDLGFFVDCNSGDTVSEALNEAQGHPGPVFITVSGVCEESVQILRDDVTMAASASGDGIRAPAGQVTISLTNARRINLADLTLISGEVGILARFGSSFQASGLVIEDVTFAGIEMEWSSRGELQSSFVSTAGLNPDSPGVAAVGGDLSITDTEISGSGIGVFARQGARVAIGESSITDNGSGVVAQDGGNVAIGDSVVTRNGTGIFVLDGSVVRADRVTVTDSSGDGISLERGSMVSFNGGVVSNNAGSGVRVTSGSTASLFSSTIENNGGDGVTVIGFSSLSGGADPDPLQILDNGGWGINCEGSPAIAAEQAKIGIALLNGNTSGDSNCPAL